MTSNSVDFTFSTAQFSLQNTNPILRPIYTLPNSICVIFRCRLKSWWLVIACSVPRCCLIMCSVTSLRCWWQRSLYDATHLVVIHGVTYVGGKLKAVLSFLASMFVLVLALVLRVSGLRKSSFVINSFCGVILNMTPQIESTYRYMLQKCSYKTKLAMYMYVSCTS